jgi:hypothetical protein
MDLRVSTTYRGTHMTLLHSLHDGSNVVLMWAKELIHVPVWQGNRIINMDHVEAIRRGIQGRVDHLDFGYHIVRSTEQDASGREIPVAWIIDGQHRHHVLRDAFLREPELADFPVVVIERVVRSELDIIQCFNRINAVKPITWSDPQLVVNEYIKEFIAVFNIKKTPFIRNGSTHRPYLSVERLRAALLKHRDLLRESAEDIRHFVGRVKKWNDQQCVIHAASEHVAMQKAATMGFLLAMDLQLVWVREFLRDEPKPL